MSEVRHATMHATPLIGEVYYMKFEGSENEQRGWRPGVVFQNNVGNAHSPNVIALPMTKVLKKAAQPTHVLVTAAESGLPKDSMVLCENPEKMSKTRIGGFITKLSDEHMKKITIANLTATSAISYLDEAELLAVWRKSIKLNGVA